MPVIEVTTPNTDDNNPQWQANKPQGALSQVPDSLDFQSPLGFRFHIRRLPNVNFYVNKVNIPGVTLPAATESTPFIDIPQPGDHPVYEPLVVNFRVDKGMKNYFEVQNWLLNVAVGDARGDNKNYTKMVNHPDYTGYGVRSEILLSILNAQKNVIRNLTFHNAWPTSLSTLQFEADLTEVRYINAIAVFKYIDYDSSTDV